MCDLTKFNRILKFASVFKLLKYVVLIEMYYENLPPQRYVSKGRCILRNISIHFGYPYLILHQNYTYGSFLRVVVM